MRISGLLLLGLLALSGCYSYSLVSPDQVAPGTRVRARITAVEAERLSEALGREARVLDGRVLDSQTDGILLQVPSAVRSAGTSVQWLSQRVEISPQALVELEQRHLDRWRTAGAVAAAAAVVGYAAAEAFAGTGSPSGEGSKGGTDRFIGLMVRFPR